MLMHSPSASDAAAFHFIYTHIYTSNSEIGWDIDFLLEEGWGQKAHSFFFSLMSTKSTIKGKLENVSSGDTLGPCILVQLLAWTNQSRHSLCLQWQWGRVRGQSQQCALTDYIRTKSKGWSSHKWSLLHIFHPLLQQFLIVLDVEMNVKSFTDTVPLTWVCQASVAVQLQQHTSVYYSIT